MYLLEYRAAQQEAILAIKIRRRKRRNSDSDCICKCAEKTKFNWNKIFGCEPCGWCLRKAHCWGKRRRLHLEVNEERGDWISKLVCALRIGFETELQKNTRNAFV